MPHATTAGPAGSISERAMRAAALKGVTLSLLAGMIFSLDGILIKQSESYAPFNIPTFGILAALLCAGIHDFCALTITTLFNHRAGLLPELFRSLRSKPGRSVICGALIGSLLGMGCYMAALRLAGPAYVLPITTLYPAVAAVLAVRILRERIALPAWIGLAMCIAGAITIGWSPPTEQTGELFYWGLACAALAAVGWGAEGVLATSGMDFIEPAVALNTYYLISSCLYLLVIIPAACMALPVEQANFNLVGEFIMSKGMLFVALAGSIGACSYRCWYVSMNLIGANRAMALNVSYALWGIMLSALFTDVEITRTLVAGAVIIFLGMFLVIGKPQDMLSLRKTD